MNITDLLKAHMTPLWEGEGDGGSGAGAGAGGTGSGDGGDGGSGEGTGDGGTGEGEGTQGSGKTTLTGKQDSEGEGSGEGGDGQQSQEGSEDGDQGKKTGDAPDDFKFEAPEGTDESFNPQIETYNTDVQKWLTDNPEATAQDALKWVADRQVEAVNKAAKDQVDAYAQQLDDWDKEARSDKELSGPDGQAHDANMAIASKAVLKLGSPALVKLLDETGFGEHPEFKRVFLKVGNLLKDSDVFTDNPGGNKGDDVLASRYDKS